MERLYFSFSCYLHPLSFGLKPTLQESEARETTDGWIPGISLPSVLSRHGRFVFYYISPRESKVMIG